jgi:hypothetical protein
MISENYNRMIEKEDTDKKGENNEWNKSYWKIKIEFIW